jgi:hypothetical protein|tara:strand:+ start:145 stop:972 length:828 start_codon:yes stop_codon:yes gene_type:complete
MSSDSQPSSQTVTTSNVEPPAFQKPFLEEGFNRAKTDVLNSPTQFFPNDTVVPFNPNTLQGLDFQKQRALSGDPTVQAAASQVQQTAQGDFLNSNPYLDQTIQNATRPIMENFNESIIPGIQSGFSNAGRYGSGLQAQQQLRAGEAAGRQASEIATGLAGQNFESERNRQLQASSMAPQFGQESYRDAANLRNVGETFESQAGAELQGDIDRFQQGETAKKDALAQYMALVGGGSFGQSTTGTTPVFRNKTSDLLGGAASAAGIAGSLFGKGGFF